MGSHSAARRHSLALTGLWGPSDESHFRDMSEITGEFVLGRRYRGERGLRSFSGAALC